MVLMRSPNICFVVVYEYRLTVYLKACKLTDIGQKSSIKCNIKRSSDTVELNITFLL